MEDIISMGRAIGCNRRNAVFIVFLFNTLLLMQHILITMYTNEEDFNLNREQKILRNKRKLNSLQSSALFGSGTNHANGSVQTEIDNDEPGKIEHGNAVDLEGLNNEESKVTDLADGGYISSVRNLTRFILGKRNYSDSVQSLEEMVKLYKKNGFVDLSKIRLKNVQEIIIAPTETSNKVGVEKAEENNIPPTRKSYVKLLGKNGQLKEVIYKNNIEQRRIVQPPDNTDYAELEAIYYKKKLHIINEYNFNYTVKPVSNKCAGDVFLIILVHSKPDYSDRRDAIRQSWGTVVKDIAKWPPDVQLGVKIRLMFITGIDRNGKWNELLKIENGLHNDILQGDFIDDYKNMTLKSLLGLKYTSEHCLHVPYMLKSDDDMFINIPFLVNILRDNFGKETIMGPYNHRSKVYRKGKWKLTKEQFPFESFPPYESGSAYIITIDIVKKLYETSKYVEWIFIDDVYITGILAKIIAAKHEVRPGHFSYWTDRAPSPCAIFKNEKVTFTRATPKVLSKLWVALQNRSLYVSSCNTTNSHKRKIR